MSQLVSRILLAILVFPLASIFYLVLYIVLDEQRSITDTSAFLLCGATTWIAVAVYWWLLWRSSVRWTGPRISGSFLAAFLSAFVASGLGTVCNLFLRNSSDYSLGAFVGSVLAILQWLIATIILWRETPTERADRLVGGKNAITCPTCGYNLTGLNEARCPECGAKFTLDELLARQPRTTLEVD